MSTHAIILSGGHGTRLWPSSRPSRPKQFLPLLDARSMFQATVHRMTIAADAGAPIVVAGAGHADEIRRQLEEMGCEAVVLIEPSGRDSGPALAAAAAWITAHDPEGVGVMVASDHHLPDAEAFRAATLIAVEAARGGAIVTFGVAPTSPSEAYGYIRAGEALTPGGVARHVRAFAEKPHAALAKEYLEAGYLWNSGNFVFRAQTLLDELDHHAPEVSAAARAAVSGIRSRRGVHHLGPAFETAPKISIDYAVMEKTDRAAVVPLDLVWSDLGAWDAVLAASPRDAQGNAVVGDAMLFDSRGCLIRSNTSQTVAALGLTNIGVIVEGDAVLVCELSSSQSVKQVVDRLKRDARAQVEAPGAVGPADATARLTRAAKELGAWLRVSALPLWWSLGADHERGGFREALEMDATPVIAPRRARVQARQAYVYALAGTLGWTGPWKAAVRHGLAALETSHLRADGGYRTLLTPDNAPLDEAVMLYDQAFILLARAWALKSGVEGDHEAVAMRILNAAVRPRRNPAGGYRETSSEHPWLANPNMHLFEAALAWEEVSNAPTWRELADELAELALTRLIDGQTGALRETFDADWMPAAGPMGRLVEPGHQFEWAWLLQRWAIARGHAGTHPAAATLIEIASANGVDHGRGVAVNALLDDFSMADANARLWPQTERLKAALLLSQTAEGQARADLLHEAAEAAAGLRRYLDTPTPGLWRDNLRAGGVFAPGPAPASSLYHVACAIAELEGWVDGVGSASPR